MLVRRYILLYSLLVLSQRLRTCSLPNLRLLFETVSHEHVETTEAEPGEEDEQENNDPQEDLEDDDEEEFDEEDGELDEDDEEEESNVGRY